MTADDCRQISDCGCVTRSLRCGGIVQFRLNQNTMNARKISIPLPKGVTDAVMPMLRPTVPSAGATAGRTEAAPEVPFCSAGLTIPILVHSIFHSRLRRFLI
jgi:hypothetical protein